MLFSLTRRKNKEWLGISFEEECVAIAHLYLKENNIPCLKFCDFFLSDKEKEQRQWLANILAENRLKNTACSIVLPAKSYQLLLVESPSVETNELREALRWQIKDMISFPAEEAVVDYFELCEHPPPGKTPMIYVAAAQKSIIQSFVDFANQQKINLSVIDIRELMFGPFLATFGSEVLSRAILSFKESSGFLAVFCESGLYLAREIPLGYQDLMAISENPYWESLALEIQRSLDYYESHFGQKPVTEVIVMPMIGEIPSLEEELSTRLGIMVKHFDFHSVLEKEGEFSREKEARSLFAIAAAFRMFMENSNHETAY